MSSGNTEITDRSQYRFSELVDVPAFARMLESFLHATGIPNGVMDASGELLSLSAGMNVCTGFHRVQPQAAERLRAAIAAAQVVPSSGLPLHFTASIGVATLKDKEANIDTLLNQADQALYRAKSEGRNRVHQYRVDDDDR